MTIAQQEMNKINAFSANRETRNAARLEMIREFRAKAIDRGSVFIRDVLKNGRIFAHCLEAEALQEFITFSFNNLEHEDFLSWTHLHTRLAIKDHAFGSARILMKAYGGDLEIDIDDFPVLTPEILNFFDSESGSNLLKIRPFLNMSWDNGAGHEGFLLLHRIVGADRLKKHILNDKNYSTHDDQYSALSLMAKIGLLDNFLDRDTINLLFARGFLATIEQLPEKTLLEEFIVDLDISRLFESLATEAKYGNSANVTHVLREIQPYLNPERRLS